MNKIEMTFSTHLGEANQETINQWEMIASRRALVNLSNLLRTYHEYHLLVEQIDNADWNDLTAIRKVLLDVRTALYGEKMEQLIRLQHEYANQEIKKYLVDSHGEFKEVRVRATVKGISATDFLAWQTNSMTKVMTGSPEERRTYTIKDVFVAHPEHYATPVGFAVLETLGGIPTLVKLGRPETVPDIVSNARDTEITTHWHTGSIHMADGTLWGYGLMEYQDKDYGCDMVYHVFWPAMAPQIFFDDHARHLAVEHRNFILNATEWIQNKA